MAHRGSGGRWREVCGGLQGSGASWYRRGASGASLVTRIPTPSRAALIGFLTYGLASLVLGEVYPLSRYPMYSSLADYTESALIEVRADGEIATLEDYEAFSGAGLAQVPDPHRVRFTMGWRLHEIRHWIDRHPAPPDRGEGPVHLEVGYRLARVTEDGPTLDGEFVVLGEGRAWPRQ